MPKGYIVTVVKEIEENVPVMADTEQEAREIVEKLIERRDTDFIFRGIDESEAEIYVHRAEAAIPQYFDALREEVETVQQDGRHDYD